MWHKALCFRKERCPCWKNVQTGASLPHIQRSQTSVHVLWVKYNVVISYRLMLPHIFQRRFPSKHLPAKTPHSTGYQSATACWQQTCTSIIQHESKRSTDNSEVTASNKGRFVCDWETPIVTPKCAKCIDVRQRVSGKWLLWILGFTDLHHMVTAAWGHALDERLSFCHDVFLLQSYKLS